MPFPLFSLLLVLGGAAAAQPLTEAEARRILETPLTDLVGPRETERVQFIAVANGLLRHCNWRWESNFNALMEQHRQGLRRPESEMQRLVVWHGAWQGQAQQRGRQERLTCDDALRGALRDQTAAALRSGPQR